MMMMRWWVSLLLTVYNSKSRETDLEARKGAGSPAQLFGSRRFASVRLASALDARVRIESRWWVRHRCVVRIWCSKFNRLVELTRRRRTARCAAKPSAVGVSRAQKARRLVVEVAATARTALTLRVERGGFLLSESLRSRLRLTTLLVARRRLLALEDVLLVLKVPAATRLRTWRKPGPRVSTHIVHHFVRSFVSARALHPCTRFPRSLLASKSHRHLLIITLQT